MIAKHIPMNKSKKSDFAGLVAYLTTPQGKQERVGLVRVTNCHSNEATPAMLEVINVQAQNTRATADKTYHLIVSFRPGEFPDDQTLKGIEDRLCAGLGLADHQRISVVHHDTDNLHMHIAINKIHPFRLTMHEPFHAYRTLGKLCDKLEDEFGLEKDNHKAKRTRGENRADDMEQHAAVESLLGWIKRECKDKMQAATTWNDMHQVMQEHGLRIHERANGLVVTADTGISVKASSISRQLSKAKLEERLGSFSPESGSAPGRAPRKRYAKQPMQSGVDTSELYARYQTAQAHAISIRSAEFADCAEQKKHLIKSAKRDGRLKRAAISLLSTPRMGKRIMYAAVSKKLVADIETINQKYLAERQKIYDKYRRRTWADWLRDKAESGDQKALGALRARYVKRGLKGNTFAGNETSFKSANAPRPDGVTKHGTIIYHVGASAIRDDGEVLNVSRGIDKTGVQAALAMAAGRYGASIKVNGNAAFKEMVAQAAIQLDLPIRFDDHALEHRRQQLANAAKTKRSKNEHRTKHDDIEGRRPDLEGVGGHGSAARADRPEARNPIRARDPRGSQRNARRVGQAAPPSARHCVRDLSELGVVHVTQRGEVLLQGHVPDHMEHQGTEPDNGLRRGLHRAGLLNSDEPPLSDVAGADASRRPNAYLSMTGKPNIGRTGLAPPPASKGALRSLSQLDMSDPSPHAIQAPHGQLAAERYIAERASTGLKVPGIPTHIPFNPTATGTHGYAGMRAIDGQVLALIEVAGELVVLPSDDATSRRLRRIKPGQLVSVTSEGKIKTKGWSR